MRTSLAIAVALLLAVAIAGTLSSGAMHALSQRYAGAAEELRELVRQEEWDRAADCAAAYLAEWRGRLPALQTLINHEDTDDVTLSLVTLEAGIAAQDRAGCLEACAQLREQALHLYHRDAFTLANVL
ncbi:MAG: DUF4363 family protein [Clostridia bacterium]|nr:DUF4363 family protein [Clostridia bacterium]